jgi:hypothetical protein
MLVIAHRADYESHVVDHGKLFVATREFLAILFADGLNLWFGTADHHEHDR